MTEHMGSAQDELLDFSNDVNVKTEEKDWQVVDAQLVDSEDGLGTQLVIELVDGETPFPRSEKFWMKHEDVPGKNWAKTVQISRANAKRFAIAATGSPRLNDPKELVGAKFKATIREDNNGFVRIEKFKSAQQAEAIS